VAPVSPPLPAALDPADPDPARRRRLASWLRLQAVLALDPGLAARLLRGRDDPEAALRAGGRTLREAAAAVDPEPALRALRACGARVLPLPSAAYPPRLAALAEPAPVLAVRGSPGVLHRVCAAVVGARAPTAYGLAVAREVATELARAGAVVVSGLARGVDGAAHRAALEAGGATAAVLAGGLDRTYPPEHRRLADAIAAEGGAVVSEFPPGTPPRAPYFPLRNRLISGLSRLVVVIEARHRSGSLVTARHAADQGVEVMAVPGPVDRATSEGTNRLIHDGSRMLLEPADAARFLADLLPRAGAAAAAEGRAEEQGLDPAVRALLDHLRRRPAGRDELLAATGASPGELSLGLVELELRGLAVLDRDGRYRAA